MIDNSGLVVKKFFRENPEKEGTYTPLFCAVFHSEAYGNGNRNKRLTLYYMGCFNRALVAGNWRAACRAHKLAMGFAQSEEKRFFNITTEAVTHAVKRHTSFPTYKGLVTNWKQGGKDIDKALSFKAVEPCERALYKEDL